MHTATVVAVAGGRRAVVTNTAVARPTSRPERDKRGVLGAGGCALAVWAVDRKTKKKSCYNSETNKCSVENRNHRLHLYMPLNKLIIKY